MSRQARRYVNIAEAKARLSELVEKAANGEAVVIARDHSRKARGCWSRRRDSAFSA